MLEVGVRRGSKQPADAYMTEVEWQSHFNMWAVTSAPLILGFDLSVRFFFSPTKFTPEDAIGSHACSLEANMRVTNGIPLGSPLPLPLPP